jgi:adenosylcobinamide kinase / adenosylcobinamide-phosphate guanylyltransferase
LTSLLVLGGARSGKSRYAQMRAEASGLRKVFVATAQAFDEEMRERIERHQADRATGWVTVEAPTDLANAIKLNSQVDSILLIDCLTLWLSNLMIAERDIDAAIERLANSVSVAAGPLILVSNEVGFGIVPDNPLARRFRDFAGIVNQRLAAAVDEVQLVVAALPIKLK